MFSYLWTFLAGTAAASVVWCLVTDVGESVRGAVLISGVGLLLVARSAWRLDRDSSPPF